MPCLSWVLVPYPGVLRSVLGLRMRYGYSSLLPIRTNNPNSRLRFEMNRFDQEAEPSTILFPLISRSVISRGGKMGSRTQSAMESSSCILSQVLIQDFGHWGLDPGVTFEASTVLCTSGVGQLFSAKISWTSKCENSCQNRAGVCKSSKKYGNLVCSQGFSRSTADLLV